MSFTFPTPYSITLERFKYNQGHNFFYWGPDPEHALDRLRQFHPVIAVDTETIGLKGDKSTVLDYEDPETGEIVPTKVKMDAKTTIGFGIAISTTEAYYFPIGLPGWKNVPRISDEVYDLIMDKVGDPNVTKIYFNANFDLRRLSDNYGLEAGTHIDGARFEDVAVAMQVQGFYNSLDRNVLRFLGIEHKSIEDVLPKGKTMLDLPAEVTAWKCIHDCMDTLELANMVKLMDWKGTDDLTWTDWLGRKYDVPKQVQQCYKIDRDCVRLQQKMSRRGVELDQKAVERHYERLNTGLLTYERIFREMGYNVHSTEQVGWMFANRGHWLPLTEGKRPKMKTDEEQLLRIGKTDGLAYMVLAARGRKKLIGTYILPVRGKEKAYTTYRLDLASGRWGSSDMNFQNLPDTIRDIFIGPWTWMDYSQIEMRVFAYRTQDPKMLKAYAEYDRGVGEGLHVETMRAIFPGEEKTLASGMTNPLYTAAKTFNFAMIFDASAGTLAVQTQLPEPFCQRTRDSWLDHYDVAHYHMSQMIQEYYSREWVPTEFGRRCHLPDNPFLATQDHVNKCILNYPIQGTAADIVKRGILLLDQCGSDIPIQVHDEMASPGDQESFLAVPLERKGLYGGILAQIHPELSTPFEVHQGEKWK